MSVAKITGVEVSPASSSLTKSSAYLKKKKKDVMMNDEVSEDF